jgi:membrane fusion protein, multidrug efflux system
MAAHPSQSSAIPSWLADPAHHGGSPPIFSSTAPDQEDATQARRGERKGGEQQTDESGATKDEPEQGEKQQALFPGAGRDEKQSGNSENKPQPGRPLFRRPLVVAAVVMVVTALVATGIAWWLYARQFESTDDAFIDGHAVQMAPKISGYVSRLNFVDNQFVHQGDVLVEIDARDYHVALDKAKASHVSALGRLAQATAQIEASEAQALAAEADVAAAEATARNAEQDQTRNSSLAPRGAVSQQTLDASVASARSTAAQAAAARARAAAAKSQANFARSQQVSADADVKEADVEIERAELNLSYTQVVAPTTGRVTHRTVELGDYLQAGQPLFAIVDPNVWVTANFKETQLTHMHKGQNVVIRVDAFPSKKLSGHVDSFQRGTGARFTLLPAENATGNYVKVVQRVPVKIIFDSPPPDDMILGLGMSVEPTVTVR